MKMMAKEKNGKDKILVLKEVRKSFGALVAVNDVNLSVKKGQLVMLIGPNGSGKTTLLNVITGTYKPDKGKILFNGTDITGWEPYKICRLGLVKTYQIPQPFMNLTVLENLLVVCHGHPGTSFLKACFKGKWVKKEEETVEKAFKILKTINLDHMWDKKSSELSGGQMKLLETARALMSGAKMILMDEPAAGIFPSLIDSIFSYFIKLKKEFGITFLIIEHRLEKVLPYVDYVYAMFEGKVISEGLAHEVLNDPKVIESYLGG